MLVENQRAIVEFLSSPATHGGAAVERIDTHSAIVFLVGARALKLKRAVRFDYLDFSTEALRRKACEAEVRVNRRTAPSLYRGVVAVTREADDSLALGGTGTAVDWLVDMARFDQDGLFDRLAARDALSASMMRPLASAIAQFHIGAERREDHGGRAGMMWVVRGNADGFVEQGAGLLDRTLCETLTTTAQREIERHGALLDARRDNGFVRQCHGDLHLRNIVLLEGRPTLFDAVEFNDEIACVDVLYDLAFLLMDLWRRRLRAHANTVFNQYLSETSDLSGLALLPLFLSCRAAVRAKTSATAARVQSDVGRTRELQDLARDYLHMAHDLFAVTPPRLIAIGGLSGSGKSTLALGLAPSIGNVPGALVLRSDEVRKRLCGVQPLQRLGPEAYSHEVTSRVYRTLLDTAGAALRAGHSVIMDAVLARSSDRAAVEHLASAESVSFTGIWLEASPEVLIARTESRGPDASDATAEIVRSQLTRDHGPVSWHHLDASPGREQVLKSARSLFDT